MGFLFEILAPMFGGMISQLYQDRKIKIKKASFLVWTVCFVCFTGSGLFDSSPFQIKDLVFSFVFSGITTAVCVVILLISNFFKSK